MPMPLRQDGEPDYTRATAKQAHQYIYNESGLTAQQADQYVGNQAAEAQKAVSRLKGKGPKMGTSIVKFKQQQAEYEERLNAAQATLDYWHAVKAEHDTVTEARRRAAAEARHAKAEAEAEAQRKRIAEGHAQEAAYRAGQKRKAEEQAALGGARRTPNNATTLQKPPRQRHHLVYFGKVTDIVNRALPLAAPHGPRYHFNLAAAEILHFAREVRAVLFHNHVKRVERVYPPPFNNL